MIDVHGNSINRRSSDTIPRDYIAGLQGQSNHSRETLNPVQASPALRPGFEVAEFADIPPHDVNYFHISFHISRISGLRPGCNGPVPGSGSNDP
jgi:hypothetical protein